MQTKSASFIQRNNTAAVWLQYNPILKKGEIGIESDTRKVKLGDGVHTWSDLEYRINNDVDVMYCAGETITISPQNTLSAKLVYEVYSVDE